MTLYFKSLAGLVSIGQRVLFNADADEFMSVSAQIVGQYSTMWETVRGRPGFHNDNNYVRYTGLVSSQPSRVYCPTMTDPGTDKGHIGGVRVRYLGGTPSSDVRIILYEGTQWRGNSGWFTPTGSWADYEFEWSESQISLISSYADIRYEFRASSGVDSGHHVDFSSLWLKIPNQSGSDAGELFKQTAKSLAGTVSSAGDSVRKALKKLYGTVENKRAQTLLPTGNGPNADTSGWSVIGASSRHEALADESDSSYVEYTASVFQNYTKFDVTTENAADPLVHTGHKAFMRVRSPVGSSGQINTRWNWFQGTSQIDLMPSKLVTVSDTWTDREFELSTADASNITNYSNIVLQLGGQLNIGEIIQISRAWIEVPPPGSGDAGGGLLTKKISTSLAGTVTSAGEAIKKQFLSLAGTVTSSGEAIKKGIKSFASSLTPGGVLSTSSKRLKALVGAVSSSGDLVKKTSKSFAGTVGSAGELIKKSFKAFAGTVGSVGELAKKSFEDLSGTVSPTGELAKKSFENLAGTVGSTGELAKKSFEAFAGTVVSAGSSVRKTSKNFVGTVSSSGDLVKKTFKSLAGVVTSSGFLSIIGPPILYFKSVVGAISPSGDLTKKTSKTIRGTIVSSGSLIKKTITSLYGTVSSSGTITKSIYITIYSTVSSSGNLAKKTFVKLLATVTSSGIIYTILNPITKTVNLVLKARDFDLVLKGRSFTKRLGSRDFNLVLKGRSFGKSLKKRIFSLTLRDKDRS